MYKIWDALNERYLPHTFTTCDAATRFATSTWGYGDSETGWAGTEEFQYWIVEILAK